MSNQKKTHELIRQNEQIVKKSKKHDANLRKNSTLYFQIGLIVCLLATFGLLEMKFESTIPNYGEIMPPLVDPIMIDVPLIRTKVPKIVEPIQQKSRKQPESFKEVPDNTPEVVFKEAFVAPKIKSPAFTPDALPPLEKKPEESVNVRFIAIQDAPIYPGCEKAKDNKARKKCMSEKITKLIQRKFEGSEIASDYGLSGIQKIDVEFTIDKTGHVTNIKTRAPHPELRKEAERVINIIPVMKPGRQHDKNVGVIYNLPIIFQGQ
jgi:protein TonB